MSFNIVESSPKAKELKPKERAKRMYPFDQLEVGKSFTCEINGSNWKSIRILTYQYNAKLKFEKEFRFIKHDDLGLVEVARIK